MRDKTDHDLSLVKICSIFSVHVGNFFAALFAPRAGCAGMG
jgi:hypothetical protein